MRRKRFTGLMAIAMILGLFQPFLTLAAQEDAATTGSIAISVQTENGTPVVEQSCFSLVSEAGVAVPFCDDSQIGIVTLDMVPTGNYTLENTSVPEGYRLAASQPVQVEEGKVTNVVVTLSTGSAGENLQPVSPPEEENPEAGALALAAAQVDSDLSPTTPIIIECRFDSATSTSDFQVLLYKYSADAPTTDDAGLVVTASAIDREFNPVAPEVYHDYDSAVRFFDKAWRRLDVSVVWPNGMTATAFADCDSSLATTYVTTLVMTDEDQPVFDGGVLPPGSTIYDTATILAQPADGVTPLPAPTGTLTYNLYKGEECTGAPVFTSVVDVVDGIADPSEPYTFANDELGVYNWQAVYSGDAFNVLSSSECGNETVIIGELEESIVTQMQSRLNNGPIANVLHEGDVIFASQVRDVATLDIDPGAGATGTVTFQLFANADCSGAPIFSDEQQLMA